MKKKLISVLAALTVLTMGTTVFAAPSPEAKPEPPKAPATTVEVSVEKNDEVKEVKTVVEDVKAVEKMDAATKAVAADAEYLDSLEVIPTREVSEKNPLTVVFNLKVTAGETIKVLHWDAVKGVWEEGSVKDVKVEDGKVTATFTALSPIMFVRVPAPATYDGWAGVTAEQKAALMQASLDANKTADGTTSPKTGAAAGAGVVALLSLAGAAVCKRKDK